MARLEGLSLARDWLMEYMGCPRDERYFSGRGCDYDTAIEKVIEIADAGVWEPEERMAFVRVFGRERWKQLAEGAD